MQLSPGFLERLKQLSASRIVDYLRSRPWLSGTTAACLILLGLIVVFQPADDALLTDNEDFENWPEVELGEFASTPAPLPEIRPLLSPSPAETPTEPSLPAWAKVQTIPTEAPSGENVIQPVHAEPYRRSPEPPAWLTGTIEEIPVEPAGFGFDAAQNGPSTYHR